MTTGETINSRLRYNAGGAGFAALLLIFFGYAQGISTVAGLPPLAWFGSELTIYAMKIGGPAMAIVALGSLSGKCVVLLLDAIVSVSIGAALGFGGLFLGVSGGLGFQDLLYIIFGFMFASAGIRNGRDYFTLAPFVQQAPVARPAERVPARDPARSVDDDPDMVSLAERLRKRVSDSTVILPAIDAEPPVVQNKEPKVNEPSKSSEPTKQKQSSPAQAGPTPDGFLASFAKKKDSEK